MDSDGFAIAFLLFCGFIILCVIGVMSLLLAIFSVGLKEKFGKILLVIGIVCVLPLSGVGLNFAFEKRANWDELGPMLQAIDKNDYGRVEKLIKKGYDVNEDRLYTYPSTALTYAISKGNTKIVRLLVENGADVNANANNGSLPLIEAIYAGNPDILKCLLENGADVSLEEGTKPPIQPIQYATGRISVDKSIVEILVQHGADINAASSNEFTPLQGAIVQKNYDVVKYLLESGADVSFKGGRPQSPLELARFLNDQKTLDLLMQYGAKDEEDTIKKD